MSNEFKFETYNGATDNPNGKYGLLRWESEGVNGDLFARTFLNKDGEELIHVMADGIQETSPRELCVAIAKISGFKVRFEDELHEVKPEAKPRQYIGKIEGVDGWVPLTPEPLGTLSSDGIDLTPQHKGEDPFAVLCELYATQVEAGASRERTAATMARIHREIEVTR